jgi:hypothetical protein
LVFPEGVPALVEGEEQADPLHLSLKDPSRIVLPVAKTNDLKAPGGTPVPRARGYFTVS